MFEDENSVGVTDGCQAVSNGYRRAVFGKFLHGALNLMFGFVVEGTGCLVEN